MTQSETENNLLWEREKHFKFFLQYYQQRNWVVAQDNIDSGQKNDWDVKLEIMAGEYIFVDEKAVRGEYKDCLVEIIQDLKTGNLGWIYSRKDWVIWGNWREKESNYPSSLYLIKSKELKDYVESLDGFIKVWIDKTGWGNTWNLVLSWQELIDKEVCEKLI